MKNLNFQPSKSKSEFHKNYKLHDLAEWHGKNLLLQWGLEFKKFGDDKRYEKVWEKGKDKPDCIVYYNNKTLLIDWKSKHKSGWIVNKRAVESYEQWSKKLNIPAAIVFFVFDEQNILIDRRVAFLSKHDYLQSERKQWDKNFTVEFAADLPPFTKTNVLAYLEK